MPEDQFRAARRPTSPTMRNDDVWQGTFNNFPAGNYEYKAPLNDALTENYGLHAVSNGANIPLNLPSVTNVKFYYDHKSHWITDNRGLTIAVAPAVSSPSWAVRATGIRAASDPGYRTSTATASTPSRRPRCRPARTRARSRSTRALTRTMGPAASRTGRTSPSPSPPAARRSPSLTTRRRTSSRSRSPAITARPAARATCRTSTSACKDCLGTARNTTSKVWYTVAGGILSDVYYPTVDNTNVETLQYIVTDGATFTDLRARDMTYAVEAVTDTGGWRAR